MNLKLKLQTYQHNESLETKCQMKPENKEMSRNEGRQEIGGVYKMDRKAEIIAESVSENCAEALLNV